jgi:hypothetical protein
LEGHRRPLNYKIYTIPASNTVDDDDDDDGGGVGGGNDDDDKKQCVLRTIR